jgi:hypothetical protein
MKQEDRTQRKERKEKEVGGSGKKEKLAAEDAKTKSSETSRHSADFPS